MENSLPGKGGQHLVCIRLGELRSPEPEWEILLSAGGVGLLRSGSSGPDRKEEAKEGEGKRKRSLFPAPLRQTADASRMLPSEMLTTSWGELFPF